MNIDSWIFYLYQGRIWVRSTRSFYYRYRIIYSIRGSVIERLKMISSEYWLKHELFDWIIRLQREIYESVIRNSIVWWKGRKNNVDLDRFERGLNEPFMIIFFLKILFSDSSPSHFAWRLYRNEIRRHDWWLIDNRDIFVKEIR